MHAALWKLFRLRMRGTVRSMVARFKSPRGAVLAACTLLFIGMIIGPHLFVAFTLGGNRLMGQRAAGFAEMVPVGMLFFTVMNIVTTAGERALYFAPSEVDFLFPAPFTRRQILVYKILGSVTAAIYFALLMPFFLLLYIRSWPAAAAGFFLASLMISSLTLCVQLIAQSVQERAFTRARRFLLGIVCAAAVVALGHAAAQGIDQSWSETLQRARHSPAAEIVLAPFSVFAKIIAAERLAPDVLGWAALGAVMIICVYAVAIRLDANYLETAARVSQQVQKRKRRLMSDGVLAPRLREVRNSRLPRPAWLGGAGPLVWRQTIQLLRGSRGPLVMIAIMLLAFGAPLLLGRRTNHGDATVLPRIIMGIAGYVPFFFSSQAPLGFRTDYERMDLLKSLPIRPLAMAVGQTFVVATVLTLVQWLLFAATAIFAPTAGGELLVAALFYLPFNWIISGTENFLFLMYPAPFAMTGSDGFLKMGRSMLFLLVKVLTLAACVALCAIPASIVYALTGSLLAAGLVAWPLLVLCSLGVLWLVAWAFARFEVDFVAAE